MPLPQGLAVTKCGGIPMTTLNELPFTNSLPLVTLTTDGGCWPNPGPGAWAYVLRFGTAYKEQAGRCTHGESSKCTNNRAEMEAIIEGLKALKKPCAVTLRTDSMYCVYMIKRKRGRKAPKINADLFEKLRDAMQRHIVSVVFVKGHAGDPDNERCDVLALEARHGQPKLKDVWPT